MFRVLIITCSCFQLLCASGESSLSSSSSSSSADHDLTHATDAHEHITQAVAYYVAPMTGVIMFGMVLASVVHNPCMPHIFHSIPESLIFIVVGVGAALFWLAVDVEDSSASEEQTANFIKLNSVLLNIVLLPVIIFESGWSLHHKDFFNQLVYILIFAVFGTLISWAMVASLIVLTGSWGWHPIVTWRIALTYSALISAVDPVASLATYASLHVEPLLNISVFGESTINDAVAIALFTVLNDNYFFREAEESGKEVHEAVAGEVFGQVCWKLFGSMFIGLTVGVIVVLIMRFVSMSHSPSLEGLLVFTSAFFMFCAAENAAVHASGIIAVLFGAIFMGVFARPFLSVEGSYLVSYFIKQAASLCDMVVFLCVGFSAFALKYNGASSVVFAVVVILACCLGRVCAMYPLGWIVNAIKKATHGGKDKQGANTLSNSRLFMMVWAGLRGGIAAVLTLELGDWVDDPKYGGEKGNKSLLFACTFMVIVFFLVVMGSTTEFFLKKFEIPMGSEVDRNKLTGGQTFETSFGKVMKVLQALLVGSERYAEYEVQAESIKTDDVYAALTSRAWGTKKVNLHHHRRFWDHHKDFAAAKASLFSCGDGSVSSEEEESESVLIAAPQQPQMYQQQQYTSLGPVQYVQPAPTVMSPSVMMPPGKVV